MPEIGTFYGLQVDHITRLKHGGQTAENNLAYACTLCNRNKGTDLGTRLETNGPIVRFFNPRIDHWDEHFSALDTGELMALTPVGEATIRIFGMNHPDSMIERRLLIAAGHLF